MRLIVTAGTVVRWHRDIVCRRRDRRWRGGRCGRPATHRTAGPVVLGLARQNESQGYRRIRGELAGPGVTVAPCTVWEILTRAGIDPAPRRDGPGRAEFLRSGARGIMAPGLCTAGLLNPAKGLHPGGDRARHWQDPGPRRNRAPGPSPGCRQARTLLMDPQDARTRARSVIHEPDASVTAASGAVLRAARARAISAPRSRRPG